MGKPLLFTCGNQATVKDAVLSNVPDVLISASDDVVPIQDGGTHADTRSSGQTASMYDSSPPFSCEVQDLNATMDSSTSNYMSCDTTQFSAHQTPKTNFGCVSPSVITGVKDLQQIVCTHRWNSVKPSTRTSRQRQWKCYVHFCSMYNLKPIPCSPMQASYYIAFLGIYIKYSSVLTYYHSVVFGHKLLGIDAPPISHPLLKSVCLGIFNSPKGITVSKDPLQPADIHQIYGVVNFSSEIDILVLVALLVMYRALLRVSHFVHSDHTLRRQDVEFVDWGMIIWIRSAKNMHLQAKRVHLPVVKGPHSEVCPVNWVRIMTQKFPRSGSSLLFSSNSWPFISYYVFQKIFKKFCKSANLSGNFASNSLRRGGASTLADLGIPLLDNKDQGLWSSDCLNKYLLLSVARKRSVDNVFFSFSVIWALGLLISINILFIAQITCCSFVYSRVTRACQSSM